MKIEFGEDINGYQDARRLRLVLEHLLHAEQTDRNTELLLQTTIADLDSYLANSPFARPGADSGAAITITTALPAAGPLARLKTLWADLVGPGRREILLSRQRQELIERAERAEAMAFEALAETAEVGRERDRLREQLQAHRDPADKHDRPE